MYDLQKQFAFIHDTIVEYITCGDTEIAAAKLEETISKMKNKNIFQHQLKVIAIIKTLFLEDS